MAEKKDAKKGSGKNHLTTQDLIGIFIIWVAIFGIAWWDMGSSHDGGIVSMLSLIPGYFLTKAIILGRI